MLNTFKLILFVFCFLGSLLSSASETNVSKILSEIDDLWRGSSSHTIATLKVQTENYSRLMTLESWSKGKEKSLTKILTPLREKGTITLKYDQNIYTYLPKTDRTIRLSGGMLMGSWMGSHLTNDDLVKESRLEDDFTASISFEGLRDGQNILEITLTPKAEAAIVWGKITLELQADTHLPISEVYYDEDMQISRTFTFYGLKMMAGKTRPSILHIQPADKPNEYTEFIFQEMDLDIPLDDSFFATFALKRHAF